MIVSMFGCIVPVLPGPTLAAVAVLLFKFCLPESISWSAVIWICVAAVVSQLADVFFTWVGAKRFGATWRGALGAVAGTIVGLFVPPQIVWVFVMPFLFAMFFEFVAGAKFRDSMRAGFGAFVGGLLALFVKITAVAFIVVVFIVNVCSK